MGRPFPRLCRSSTAAGAGEASFLFLGGDSVSSALLAFFAAAVTGLSSSTAAAFGLRPRCVDDAAAATSDSLVLGLSTLELLELFSITVVFKLLIS